MKTVFTILSVFLFTQMAISQPTYFGPTYTHLNSGSNCFGNYTLLDPLIIGYVPSDIVIFNHVYGTPSGTHEAYMVNSFGLWDSGSTWSLFDETLVPIDTNLAFNVLNAKENGTGIIHTVTTGNSVSNWSLIDHPLLNNNPNAVFFISKTWANGVYDTNHVGIWYSEGAAKWSVYNEDGSTPLQINSTYNIFIPDAGKTFYKHVATSTNYITVLDHPLLNGNPDAIIYAVHDYTNNVSTIGYINDDIGVWYDGANWTLYAEVNPTLFVGATFNVLIVSDVNTGIENKTDQTSGMAIFPNPAGDQVNIGITDSGSLEISSLSLLNTDGRIVLAAEKPRMDGGKITLNVSGLPSGLYFLKLESQNKVLSGKVTIMR